MEAFVVVRLQPGPARRQTIDNTAQIIEELDMVLRECNKEPDISTEAELTPRTGGVLIRHGAIHMELDGVPMPVNWWLYNYHP